MDAVFAVLKRPESSMASSGTGVTDGCGSPCRSWELNLGPLEEELLHLCTESSPVSPTPYRILNNLLRNYHFDLLISHFEITNAQVIDGPRQDRAKAVSSLLESPSSSRDSAFSLLPELSKLKPVPGFCPQCSFPRGECTVGDREGTPSRLPSLSTGVTSSWCALLYLVLLGIVFQPRLIGYRLKGSTSLSIDLQNRFKTLRIGHYFPQ